jgi:sporulation protein YlmC with PRC-barrel domain
MQLSQLIQKNIRVGKNAKGMCVGVGISIKSKAVKYLLCCSNPSQNTPVSASEKADFAISVSAIERISHDEIVLSNLRAVFPKNCAKISLGKAIYSEDGVYLGKIADLEMHNFQAIKLWSDCNFPYSPMTISACSDVVILRKEQAFPLGERIPAPILFPFLKKNESVVTKSILRSAIQNGQLLRLTLSLPPFQFQSIHSAKDENSSHAL